MPCYSHWVLEQSPEGGGGRVPLVGAATHGPRLELDGGLRLAEDAAVVAGEGAGAQAEQRGHV